MNGKHYRPKTGTCYDTAEEVASAIEKERAYADKLGKGFAELTRDERLAAIDYKPAEKPETKKIKSSSNSKSEDAKSKTNNDGEDK